MLLVVGLTVAAFCTAIISGAIGLGGGTILVAILMSTELSHKTAIATHAAVQLVSNAARTVAYFQHVKWSALGLFLIGAIPTPFIVAPALVNLDKSWAQLVLGVFILFLTLTPKLKELRSKSSLGLIIAGALAGGVGMVVGATGTLIAPFYMREGWSRESVIGTKALCQSSAHVVKLIAFSTQFEKLAGMDWTLILPMSVALVIGTFVGKKIGSYLNEKLFKKLFRVTIVLAACYLIIRALVRIFGVGWI